MNAVANTVVMYVAATAVNARHFGICQRGVASAVAKVPGSVIAARYIRSFDVIGPS